jgi:FkbM family methyltransferase
MRSLIERNPRVRSLVKSDRVQRALHSVRGAHAVHERAAFMSRELRGRGTASYRLHNGMKVAVRHGTPDMSIFTRVFWRRIYDPPAELRGRLERPLRVLDLGANIGLFSASIGPRATVVAVEADRNNAVLLEKMISANGVPWRVINAYAAASNGTVNFAGGNHCFSRAAEVGEPLTKIDVFPMFADVDLLKMDIEGGEWPILTDPRMRSLKADAMVLEWHDRGCPEPDAHSAAARLLREAGYGRIEEVEVATHNGVIWAWRDSGAAN